MFFLLAQHALASGLLTDAVTELDAPANEQFEMSEMFVPVVTALLHLNLEESVMVCFALWPLSLGLMATLRVLTGATKHAAFDAAIDADAGDGVAAVAASMHLDLQKSTSSMTLCVSNVEQQIVELQKSHDTRFADMHKDLAGIVWELSKLRADMARWQALAQLSVKSSALLAQSEKVLPVGVGEDVETPSRARVWRGDGK